MLLRKEIPGGWYGECLPTGEYAVAVRGSHIEAHLGTFDFPEYEKGQDGLRFIRVSPVEPFTLAGQPSFAGQGTAVWSSTSGWYKDQRNPFGVSPCIFDHDGELIVNDGSVGSQGYRFIDETTGAAISGDLTYNAQTALGHALGLINLWEYTVLGDIVIGQGENGAVVRIDGVYRTIEPGDCRFIRANGTARGDLYAITIVKLQENKTVLLWMTRAELAQLPEVVAEVVSVPSPPAPPAPAPPATTSVPPPPASPKEPPPVTTTPAFDPVAFDQKLSAVLAATTTMATILQKMAAKMDGLAAPDLQPILTRLDAIKADADAVKAQMDKGFVARVLGTTVNIKPAA